MSALFGPAGNGDAFSARFKASVDAPAYLHELGVDLYEYQCGRGVNVGEATARKIGAEAARYGIGMSVHAPYFISLSTIDDVKRLAKLGIHGAIIGKAYYTNAIELGEAIEVAK